MLNARTKIEDEISMLNIDCDYKRVSGYYYTEDEKDAKDVAEVRMCVCSA